MYDLNALVAAQIEFGEEALLLCVQFRQAGGRGRLLLAGLARIDLAYPVGCQNGRLQDGILHKQRQTRIQNSCLSANRISTDQSIPAPPVGWVGSLPPSEGRVGLR